MAQAAFGFRQLDERPVPQGCSVAVHQARFWCDERMFTTHVPDTDEAAGDRARSGHAHVRQSDTPAIERGNPEPRAWPIGIETRGESGDRSDRERRLGDVWGDLFGDSDYESVILEGE